MRRLLITLLLALLPCAMGQYFEPPPINPDPLTEPPRKKDPEPRMEAPFPADAADGIVLVPREKTRVAVLAYHGFNETKPEDDSLPCAEAFRKQMEQLRRENIRVISLKEFLDWRLGNLHLPARCVLITLDDGGRSVFKDIFPILQECGYPFTIFLSTKALSGGADGLTPAMIRKMQQHGASVGSHSATLASPKEWKAAEAEGELALTTLMDREFGSSQKRLSELFGPVNTYCYPSGYLSQQMMERLPSYGYVAAFDRLPGRVASTEDVWQIHRYMIRSADAEAFETAIDFDGRRRSASGANRRAANAHPSPMPPFPVIPLPDSVVKADIPVISAKLAGISGVDPSSVRMVVSGFGRVPARVDSATSTIQWVPPFRIYLPGLTVRVSWSTFNGSSHSAEWSFFLDDSVTLEP